jgi:hypothetical protein
MRNQHWSMEPELSVVDTSSCSMPAARCEVPGLKHDHKNMLKLMLKILKNYIFINFPLHIL